MKDELEAIEKFFLCMAGDAAHVAESLFREATQGLISKGYLVPQALDEDSDLTADQSITAKGREFIASHALKE